VVCRTMNENIQKCINAIKEINEITTWIHAEMAYIKKEKRKYQVKINFNDVSLLAQELDEINDWTNSTNFRQVTTYDILYFVSGSKTANYDFLIDDIDHDEKTVLLVAV